MSNFVKFILGIHIINSNFCRALLIEGYIMEIMKTVLSYIETQKIAVINRNLSIPVNDA
jgi:hypothetical protein